MILLDIKNPEIKKKISTPSQPPGSKFLSI